MFSYIVRIFLCKSGTYSSESQIFEKYVPEKYFLAEYRTAVISVRKIFLVTKNVDSAFGSKPYQTLVHSNDSDNQNTGIQHFSYIPPLP